MSDGKNSNASNHGESNLLYGILAMQMDFISREDLIAATSVWVKEKSVPLSQLLLERNMIDPAVHQILQSLLLKHLEQHDNDARKSLASLSSIGSLREDLGSINDADVEASLVHVAASVPDSHVVETIATEATHVGPGGRYRVLRPHARGGLGEVFVAHDKELHRDVALKQIKQEHAKEMNSRARFTMEAEITGRLEHPGVVPVYGLGTDAKGCPFYVMRFIQGDSLKEAIQRFHRTNPLTGAGAGVEEVAAGTSNGSRRPMKKRELSSNVEFRQLLGRFVDVCDAIQYAHSRGVLHRDLKPGNIMLGRDGETLVVDWGLAKLMGHRSDSGDADEATMHSASGSGSSITQMGQTVGTPQYMSPEQASGKLDEIGTESDVYSLGSTFYSVLTGQAPFPEPSKVGTGEVLRKVQRGEFAPPRAVRRGIPPALDAICLKAMALVPNQRYASPRELANDVERWLADAAVKAYRNPMYRVRLWVKNHRTAVASACAVLVLLAAALGYFGNRFVRINRDIEQHFTQAGLLVAAGDFDRAKEELAVAATLADDPLVSEHWSTDVADRQKKLGQYERFLNASRAARFYVPEGVDSFSDMRDAGTSDELADLCRSALNEFRVLEDAEWKTSLEPSLFSDKQRELIGDEVGELLVNLAMRTAFVFEDNEAGNRTTREALEMLDRAEELIAFGPGINSLRMLWYRRINEDEKANAAGDVAKELAKQHSQKPHVIDQYVMAQTAQVISKDPKAAISRYHELLKLRPNHFRSQFGLFSCYMDLKDLDGQRRHLEACIALDPQNALLNYLRGMSFFTEGDYRRAYDDFDTSVRKNDKFAIGYFYRGRMNVVFEDWLAADEDFTQAVSLDRKYSSAYYWRAIARAKLGQYEGAVADAESALELSPDDALTQYYTARAYAQAVGAAQADRQNRPQSEELADQYKQKAVQILRRGIEQGFDDFTRVVPGGDFTPLYDSPEYRRVVLDALADRISKREAELADAPGDPKQRLQLAEWYLAQVEMRTGAKPPNDADIAQLDTTFKMLGELFNEGQRSAASLISRVFQRQGELLDRMNQPDEATIAWKKMALLDKSESVDVAIDRAHNLAKWGQHVRAMELLEGELESPELSAGHCYNAACVLSLASAAVAADSEMDEDERKELSQEHADRAIGFLQRARDLEYFEKEAVRHGLQRDADLVAIRDREEFQELLRGTGLQPVKEADNVP